jgi:hypothetical protein
MAAWRDGAWRNISKDSALPLTKLQSDVLRLLAAGRSPDSYVAGGVALNREGPRFSGDIGYFPGFGAAARECCGSRCGNAGQKRIPPLLEKDKDRHSGGGS